MQKKHLILTGILLIAILSFGLYFVEAVEGNYHPYLPLKLDNQWIYQITLPNNSVVIQTIGVSNPINGIDRMLVLVNKAPFAEIQYVSNEKGLFKIKQITSNGISSIEPMQMVLPADLKVGAAWSWESSDKKNKEKGKVIGPEKVTVPKGTFDSILVQYEGTIDGVSYVDKTWFVKDIGNVKTVYTSLGKTTTTMMLDFKFRQ